MDLSIIIVNYFSREKLAACLRSIAQATLRGLTYEIILVENNSGEDLNYFLSSADNIKLIQSPRNLGMGGGNNLGIEAAQGEYILILNPDTLIKPGSIETLVTYLKNNPSVGIVGPKLLNPDGSLQYSCRRFPNFFLPLLRRTSLGKYFAANRDNFQMADWDHNSIAEVDWLMGSSLLFRKKIVLLDGQIWQPRFDERYFMYFEDIDLCKTAHSLGLKVIYHPEAVLIHDHARQSAKYPWYQAVIRDALARQHIISWLKYFLKWLGKNKKSS